MIRLVTELVSWFCNQHSPLCVIHDPEGGMNLK